MDQIYSGFGKTLRELADQEDDPSKKRKMLRLASELELFLNQQANNTQVALGSAELSWHNRLDEVLGEIKKVDDSVKGSMSVSVGIDSKVDSLTEVVENQGAAVVQLRMEFQSVAETVNGIVTDVNILKRAMRESTKERERLSDKSIENRDLIDDVIKKLDILSDTVNRALIELHSRPSVEDTADLIRRFYAMEDDIKNIKDNQ